MPILFPAQGLDSSLVTRRLNGLVPGPAIAPNLQSPGKPYTVSREIPSPAMTPAPLLTQAEGPGTRPVVRDVQTTSRDFAMRPPTDRRVFQRVKADTRNKISGTSYDSAGVALPLATVLVFSTATNEYLGQTTSDAAGAWSFYVTRGWPLFLVEYKAGATDVAGTSVNTIIPTIT